MCTSAVCDVGARKDEAESLMIVDGVPGPSKQAVLMLRPPFASFPLINFNLSFENELSTFFTTYR